MEYFFEIGTLQLCKCDNSESMLANGLKPYPLIDDDA